MTKTAARIGYGTIYEIWDATIPGFVKISEVIEVNPGDETADRVEATHMESPDRRREYIAGLIDSGEGEFTINWVPNSDTDVLLRTLFESGDVVDHRVTFPNGVKVTYDASLIGYAKAIPLDDRMTAVITVATSGAQTWAAAAAPTNTVLPAISGIAQVGQTLTALEGVWTGAPSFTYQWQEDDTGWGNIAGATGRTYAPVVGNVGNPLRVIVTGTNSVDSASATSAATAAVIAE